MRGSEVFWETALYIDNNTSLTCCCPIMCKFMFGSFVDYRSNNFTESKEFQLFKEFFKPKDSFDDKVWFNINDQKTRVYMMLFMELIWEDEYGNT